MLEITAQHVEWFFELELPEDFPRGLYVLFGSETPSEYRAGFALGYYSPDLDVVFQPHLEALGRWTGRKPALFIDDSEVRRIAADPWAAQGSGAARYIRERLIGIALHEAAHALTTPLDNWDYRPHPQEIEQTTSHVQKWAAEPAEPEKEIPWKGHDLRFIRAALHLHARAVAADFGCELRRVASLENYRLGSLSLYAEALGAELRESVDSGQSIREVLDTPAPVEFAELWRSDTERFLQVSN